MGTSIEKHWKKVKNVKNSNNWEMLKNGEKKL